jgi:hypothetical protein
MTYTESNIDGIAPGTHSISRAEHHSSSSGAPTTSVEPRRPLDSASDQLYPEAGVSSSSSFHTPSSWAFDGSSSQVPRQPPDDFTSGEKERMFGDGAVGETTDEWNGIEELYEYFLNERCAPEVLEYPLQLVENVLEMIEMQVRHNSLRHWINQETVN